MAQPTGAFSSYDAVGNREDLTDMIWDVSPTATPIISAAGKGKSTNRTHEWQTDALTAVAANAHIEGDDADPSAPAATTRLSNYTQILKKHVVVTGTQEDGMNPAGRNKELAYQKARRLKEIKRDLEYAVAGVNNPKVAGNDTTAREMGSIQTYLTSNTNFNTGDGADPAGNSADGRTDGTQRALTEAMLQDVLQSCFDNGGDPSLMVVGSYNKGVVSGFDGGQTAFQDKSDKKLVNAVDIYVGDFHELRVVADHFSRSRDALLIDPSHVKMADMRAVHSYDLAKTGDSYRQEIVWETTLEVCNEAAHGIIADLTTA
jgi:hypothetical protein